MVAGRLFGSTDRANLENSVLDTGRLPDPCKGLKAASEASMVNEPRQRTGDHGQAVCLCTPERMARDRPGAAYRPPVTP